jgi:predicted lipid-binding transport protein (Tim44 family)
VKLAGFIPSGIAASALVHLSVLAIILVFAEVHPFSSVTAEPIAVDIVAPDQVKPEPAPTKTQPSDTFDQPASSVAPGPTPSAAPPPPPKQAAAQPEQQAALAPDPVGQQPAAPSSSPSPPPSAAYIPAQPDLSVKYHVMLGLPVDRPADGFDAPATQKADVGSGPVAEFRRHLRTCSTLPESIAASDKIAIKLRVLMNPDGRLAAAPMLIEASASAKGPLLMQSAIVALNACQPYAMLPADKYREWRVLDLTFTPQDFNGAS